MDEKKIYTSLIAIMKGVTAIEKTKKNQQQGFNYRGIDDVMNELHGLFAANEVVILPYVQNIEQTERTGKSGGLLLYVKVTMKYTFIASDGSYVETSITGEAMDSGDKATNKAMSIALKYALMQMFLIPTEELKDPDADSPEVADIRPKKEAAAQQKPLFPSMEKNRDKFMWAVNNLIAGVYEDKNGKQAPFTIGTIEQYYTLNDEIKKELIEQCNKLL